MLSAPAIKIPLTISEDGFQAAIIDLALFYGWRVCHFRPARTAKGWRTSIIGHKGFPDLVLARHGRVITAELKRQKAKVEPEQLVWLHHLGEHARTWRPSDWPEIAKELR
jgi:hypothetical protein